MCKTFAEHLMGKEMFAEAARALEKNQSHLSAENQVATRHFASFKTGSIDYTPHQDTIRILIEAMDNNKICKITYKSMMASRAKSFYIKPLKIFSHKSFFLLPAYLRDLLKFEEVFCPTKVFDDVLALLSYLVTNVCPFVPVIRRVELTDKFLRNHRV